MGYKLIKILISVSINVARLCRLQAKQQNKSLYQLVTKVIYNLYCYSTIFSIFALAAGILTHTNTCKVTFVTCCNLRIYCK